MTPQTRATLHWIALAITGWLVVLWLGATSCRGSVVTPEFVEWVAMKESGGNPKARGKAGELGAMQLRAIAVREVNRVYGTAFTHADALNPSRARAIGRRYLLICESRVAVKTRENIWKKYRGAK